MKKTKNDNVVEEYNLYNFDIDDENTPKNKETLDDMMKRKKAKERERRIAQNKKNFEKDENFNFDTETVIGMAQRNKNKKNIEERKEFDKKQRRRKRRIKKVKIILKILLLIAIIIGAIVFATCSPIFNISEIEVVNNSQISTATIISLSKLTTGENIFKFFSSQVENNIKQNAYIESVSIKRILPNKIQIDVEERVASFAIPILDSYAYITTQGYIVEISQNELALPIINGLQTSGESIAVGNRIEEVDYEGLEKVLKIMSALESCDLDDKVTSIDISDESDYIVYMETEQKTIHFGEVSDLANKIPYIEDMLEEESGIKGDIFANGNLSEGFKIFFREDLSV